MLSFEILAQQVEKSENGDAALDWALMQCIPHMPPSARPYPYPLTRPSPNCDYVGLLVERATQGATLVFDTASKTATVSKNGRVGAATALNRNCAVAAALCRWMGAL